MTTRFSSVPQPPQLEPTPVVKPSGEGGKARKKEPKEKATSRTTAPPQPPKCTTWCALCDVVSHATHTFPELPRLKPMVNEAFPESDIPKVYVTIPDLVPKLKSLCINPPCDLCDFHGYYTHLYPRLNDYYASLATVCQFKAMCNDFTSPLFASSASAELEDMPTSTDIPPPDVEMMEPLATIFYLLSSMRPAMEDPSGTSPPIPHDLHSTITLGSTSIYTLYA